MTVGPRWIEALRKADLGVVLDILIISLVIVNSITLNSPFLFLYYLEILETSVRLQLRQALATSVVITGMVALFWTRVGRGELLETPGFQLGAFTAGGFFLALFIGTLIQEHRAAADLAQAYDAGLDGWSRALDLRDKETEGHTQRVAQMTMRLARAVGVPKADLVHIHRGALLHDIGKMAVPDNILFKPGPLTPEEWEVMRRHPGYAYDLLSPIAYLHPALDIPYCHHEKWDGTGYPRGLRGEQIPLSARIFAVADVWDALRSDRPYRPAWPDDRARAYIVEQAGKHFETRIVEVFLQIESKRA
jgi:HD-GYP domain-containing protein (c-di-GMP phosphodiesterase class II)